MQKRLDMNGTSVSRSWCSLSTYTVFVHKEKCVVALPWIDCLFQVNNARTDRYSTTRLV